MASLVWAVEVALVAGWAGVTGVEAEVVFDEVVFDEVEVFEIEEGAAAWVTFVEIVLFELVELDPLDVIDLVEDEDEAVGKSSSEGGADLVLISYGFTSTLGGGAIDENKSLTNGFASDSSIWPMLLLSYVSHFCEKLSLMNNWRAASESDTQFLRISSEAS